MKKLVLSLLLLFLTQNAHASIINLPSFLSGNDVTISNLNSLSTTMENWANGDVEGNNINIKPGSIYASDLSDSISPVTRWAESFNDYTISGMLPATSASLTSDISAGVSYVNGYRIDLAATSHTYTASKDTYVYINEGGYYLYSEVANGAAAPSTPANSLLLAVAITNGTAISSVTDSRTLSIQITTTTTNFPANFRNAAFISRDSTSAFHAKVGDIAIGNTIYSRTINTSSKNIALGTNWIEGVYAPGAAARVFLYAYNDAGSSWDFKYSTRDVAYSDTVGNSEGILRYYSDGSKYYRAMGWAYLSADAVAAHQWSDFSDTGVLNSTIVIAATDVTSTATAFTDGHSFVPDMRLDFYSTGRMVEIEYNAPHYKQGNGIVFQLASNGSVLRTTTTITQDTQIPIVHILWRGILSKGMNTITLQWKNQTSTGTIYQRGATDGQRMLSAKEL
jgi:hypothetical protein